MREKHSSKEYIEFLKMLDDFDEVNEEPVVYRWKYKLEEIDPSEEVIVDTSPVKKSS